MTLLTAADKRTLDLSGQIASDTILITNGLQIWLAHLICLELHTGKRTNGRWRPGNCQCNGLSRGSVKSVINHQMLWEWSTYKLDSLLSGGCKWIRSDMATRSRAFSRKVAIKRRALFWTTLLVHPAKWMHKPKWRAHWHCKWLTGLSSIIESWQYGHANVWAHYGGSNWQLPPFYIL